MEKLLTTRDVCEMFGGINPKTVTQKFIKEGLKYLEIGRKDYRYERKDVEEFKDFKKQLSQNKIINFNPNRKVKNVTISTKDSLKREANAKMKVYVERIKK